MLPPIINAANIGVIIWDLDGTKYRFHPNIHTIANRILAEVISRLLASHGKKPLSIETINEISNQSYRSHGLSWLLFADMFELDREVLFREFNDSMPLESVASVPCPRYKEQIHELKEAGVKNIILTHGTKDWARKVLEKLDMSSEFPDGHIFDIGDLKWGLKNDGTFAYQELKKRYPYRPSESLMVEDSVQNLVGAKSMGMTTVLIDRGPSEQSQQHVSELGHVDYVFNSPQQFLDHFLTSMNQTDKAEEGNECRKVAP